MNDLNAWAQALKRNVMTMWFALKHPQTPWYARVFAAIVTAYALSPIDLISTEPGASTPDILCSNLTASRVAFVTGAATSPIGGHRE